MIRLLSVLYGTLIGLTALAAPTASQGPGVTPERSIFPGSSFTFCRVEYNTGSRGNSGYRGYRRRWSSWQTDYPESDINFSLRLSQLTTLQIRRDPNGTPVHAVVRLDSSQLFHYPFIYMLEVGRLALDQDERTGLRDYLLRGGFLMIDDFWGDDDWDNWEYEISQVLPPEIYPMVDIPPEHELFNIVFKLDGLPQVPSVSNYRNWEATGQTYEGRASSYRRYGTAARCKGIFDAQGRLMVVALHNTDLGDGWEREGENYGYFKDFSVPKAYPMGVNIVVYAMTH